MWMYQMIALNIYISIGLLLSILLFFQIQRSRVVDQELNDQINLMGNRYWISLIGITTLFWLPAFFIRKKR